MNVGWSRGKVRWSTQYLSSAPPTSTRCSGIEVKVGVWVISPMGSSARSVFVPSTRASATRSSSVGDRGLLQREEVRETDAANRRLIIGRTVGTIEPAARWPNSLSVRARSRTAWSTTATPSAASTGLAGGVGDTHRQGRSLAGPVAGASGAGGDVEVGGVGKDHCLQRAVVGGQSGEGDDAAEFGLIGEGHVGFAVCEDEGARSEQTITDHGVDQCLGDGRVGRLHMKG